MIRSWLAASRLRRRLKKHDVSRAYELLFHRAPESPDVIQVHADNHGNVWSLLAALLESDEFQRPRRPLAPHTTLDWRAILERYRQPNLRERPGYFTNFLGVETRIDHLGHLASARSHTMGLPIPGDFHCTTSEWVACLRGVDLSSDEFVAVELGAGWGPWMVNLMRAAAIRGARTTRAIGCEADRLHCAYMLEHFAHNGVPREACRVFQGAVGPRRGVTLFPVSPDSTNDWGLRPIFCSGEQEADAIAAAPAANADYRGVTFERFHRVPCYTLDDVLADAPHVDVMHVDVQGGEYDLVAQALDLLNRKVRYLVIGTHGRRIEGDLIALLAGAGWQLEVEEPCEFDIHDPAFAPRNDGTQGWRNARLAPTGADSC
jgi:FkbM family methyltransferase